MRDWVKGTGVHADLHDEPTGSSVW
jgi:hypothetical protein